ncbi:GPW/gp25 family protein [Brevibacillus antibioticus]|uniref:GPW/gp25 family protein n=1 Tax=Brevibacillus antibioticus TaxID=2570228 RepID=A0A4U2Y5A9_9BACL|nr:GPW/gp25 family protein [Brevibacillus antibioticus]TKI54351.1 GPW/gp25 family protein [Brevibacillus antibioticus]
MRQPFGEKGWKFPIQVDQATGRIRLSDYEDDIAEAIRIILSTAKGERVMRPKFGSRLQGFMFDGTDGTSLALLQSDIAEAIMIWEPRVRDVQVEAKVDKTHSETVNVTISYTVRATNKGHQLLYPVHRLGPHG